MCVVMCIKREIIVLKNTTISNWLFAQCGKANEVVRDST